MTNELVPTSPPAPSSGTIPPEVVGLAELQKIIDKEVGDWTDEEVDQLILGLRAKRVEMASAAEKPSKKGKTPGTAVGITLADLDIKL